MSVKIPKFQIGDRVRVIGGRDEICTICDAREGDAGYGLEGPGGNHDRSWWFHDKQLEMVCPARGDIVLTSRPDGELVAVSRQDEEGKILSVIWTKY